MGTSVRCQIHEPAFAWLGASDPQRRPLALEHVRETFFAIWAKANRGGEVLVIAKDAELSFALLARPFLSHGSPVKISRYLRELLIPASVQLYRVAHAGNRK